MRSYSFYCFLQVIQNSLSLGQKTLVEINEILQFLSFFTSNSAKPGSKKARRDPQDLADSIVFLLVIQQSLGQERLVEIHRILQCLLFFTRNSAKSGSKKASSRRTPNSSKTAFGHHNCAGNCAGHVPAMCAPCVWLGHWLGKIFGQASLLTRLCVGGGDHQPAFSMCEEVKR